MKRAESLATQTALLSDYDIIDVQTFHHPDDRCVEAIVTVEVYDFFDEGDLEDWDD